MTQNTYDGFWAIADGRLLLGEYEIDIKDYFNPDSSAPYCRIIPITDQTFVTSAYSVVTCGDELWLLKNSKRR